MTILIMATKNRPPSASRGPDYLKGWSGGYLGVDNFPKPAEVIWRSKDGVAREAEIDIGEIFKDELIRHHVPREEMADLPDGKYESNPSILLEVNDRTITSVYERTYPPQEEVEIAGHMRNDCRDDVILGQNLHLLSTRSVAMGQVLSRGDSRPVTAEELQAIATMREALSQLPVPTLQHRDNPHEYLFFAFSTVAARMSTTPNLVHRPMLAILATRLKS